jgi:hypothetical protein
MNDFFAENTKPHLHAAFMFPREERETAMKRSLNNVGRTILVSQHQMSRSTSGTGGDDASTFSSNYTKAMWKNENSSSSNAVAKLQRDYRIQDQEYKNESIIGAGVLKKMWTSIVGSSSTNLSLRKQDAEARTGLLIMTGIGVINGVIAAGAALGMGGVMLTGLLILVKIMIKAMIIMVGWIYVI